MPPRGNPSKLIPTNRRTKQEVSEIGRKGGIASGKARKEKAFLSDMYAELLAEEFEIEENGTKKRTTGKKHFKEIARKIVERRDSAAVSMLKEIREATEGSKATVQIDDISKMSREEREAEAKRLEEESQRD